MAARDEPTFESLMAAMQQGDREATRDLLQGASAVAAIQARRFLRMSGVQDQSLVEDVVQETLLAIFEKRQTYDPAQPFLPWLTAITRYKSIDRMRRAKWRVTDLLGPDHDALPAATVDPETRLELERQLAKLPARARRAVELVKLEGLSHAEAAERLGIGESALKVSVHRALKRLKGDAS